MKVHSTPLDGLKVIELNAFGDKRGFFVERFRADEFRTYGINADFVQDNHSRSAPGVLRGLHYQTDPAQGKLVGVARGRIWDVALDLRKGSPTFGKYFAEEISDENHRLLWIPYGFAHGFCVLGEEPADVLYSVTGYYNPKTEGGVRFDDPMLQIPWPLKTPTVSERDRKLPLLSEIKPL